MEKISYKGIKPKETIWVTYFNIEHIPAYCITSDVFRSNYFLYEYNSDKNEWNKTNKKDKNPLNLSDIVKKAIFNFDEKSVVIENKVQEVSIPETITEKSKKKGRPPKNKLF